VSDRKPTYAPLPARVMGDQLLSALDIRVLMSLAAHDRLGANGIGCYASHERLAALVSCHLKSLSRSLRTLAEKGYIEPGRHPTNARLRVYKVVYREFDAEYLKRAGIGNEAATYIPAVGNKTVTPDSPEIGNHSVPIGNHLVPENRPIGNNGEKIDQLDHADTSPSNIFPEYKRNTSRETSPAAPLGDVSEALLRSLGKKWGAA
jgi:hypothetical protein